MSFRRLTYFFLLLLYGLLSRASDLIPVLYDSAVAKTIIPTHAEEREIFDQTDLKLMKKKAPEDLGFLERLLNWFLDLVFGHSDRNSRHNFLTGLIWILAIVGLGILIWLFTRSEFTSFLKGNTKPTQFNFSDVEEDISGIDFDDRVLKALQANDYRFAIRWLYLKQLYELNKKNRLMYQPYKTNIDYSQELSKTEYQKPFITLSKIYDYVWYGQYPVTSDDYRAFEKQFKEFENTVNV